VPPSRPDESRLAREARQRVKEYERRLDAASARATEARRKADEAGRRQSQRHVEALEKLSTDGATTNDGE